MILISPEIAIGLLLKIIRVLVTLDIRIDLYKDK